jgi:hypothetical protein
MSCRPLVAGVVALVALGLGFGAGAASPAGAQDGAATIEVEQAHPAEASVHYFVRLTGAGGEPVSGATLTATPRADDGTEGAPATMTPDPDPGLYQGTVELSAEGTWSITFESTDPAASLDYTQEMPAEESSGGAGSSGGDDDGGGRSVVLIVVGVVVVILLAFGAWALLGRRREPEPTDPRGQ